MMWKKALSVHEIIIAILMIIGAFHQLRTHLRGGGGVKPSIHFHCVLHAKKKGGWGGGSPDSM